MALANGGGEWATCILQTYRNSCKFFFESDKKKKKNGYGHRKNSGERSRVKLALLFHFYSVLFNHSMSVA